jgi:hypothetical protein
MRRLGGGRHRLRRRRLDQRGIIVLHAVDALRNRLGGEHTVGGGSEQVTDVLLGGIEPSRVVLGRNDDGHAIVHRAKERVGLRGEDRARVEHFAVWREPALVDARHAERLPVEARDMQRLLARGDAPPFVEAVRGNEAAVPAEGLAQARAYRLRTHVDHARADRRIPRPARHEPPAQLHELALALGVDAHHGDELRRRDVVVRLDRRRVREAERKRDRGRIAVQLVATAHG